MGVHRHDRCVSDDASTISGRVLFRSEVGAESPLWTESGTMIDLDVLPIPRDLQKDLQAWTQVAWQKDSLEVKTRGRELLAALRDSLDEIEPLWDED